MFCKNKKIIKHKYSSIKIKGNIIVNNQLDVGYAWNKVDYGFTSLILKANSTFETYNFKMISGSRIILNENAKLKINSGYMNYNSSIICDKSITIGDDVTIAPGVTIRDNDAHTINNSCASQPVIIGNHVWIGTNAIILKGVHIGNNVVVAAGSIVNKNVPDNCLVAGVPAKIKKKNINWK